jgi:hypothetical protein
LAVTRDTDYRDREKSLGPTQLFDIETIVAIRKESQLPSGKAELMHSISLHLDPLVSAILYSVLYMI